MNIYYPFWISFGLSIITGFLIRHSMLKERRRLLAIKNPPDDIDSKITCNIVPFIGSLFIIGIISVMFWTGLFLIWDEYTKTVDSYSIKYELVAIKNKDVKENSGSFGFFVCIGGGSYKETVNSYYYYYVKYQNGIQLEKKDVFDKSIFINENENKDAYVNENWTRWKSSDSLVKFFRCEKYSCPRKHQTILNIPKGTINREFKIEL